MTSMNAMNKPKFGRSIWLVYSEDEGRIRPIKVFSKKRDYAAFVRSVWQTGYVDTWGHEDEDPRVVLLPTDYDQSLEWNHVWYAKSTNAVEDVIDILQAPAHAILDERHNYGAYLGFFWFTEPFQAFKYPEKLAVRAIRLPVAPIIRNRDHWNVLLKHVENVIDRIEFTSNPYHSLNLLELGTFMYRMDESIPTDWGWDKHGAFWSTTSGDAYSRYSRWYKLIDGTYTGRGDDA
jgi:hypothetical protein